jgi:four helix bundle protein
VPTDSAEDPKLKVYQKGLEFASLRSTLLDGLSRRVAACDHLDCGAESILVNIAHASSSWAPKDRIVYLGYANGSALECAGCLDVFVAKALLATANGSADVPRVEQGRELLRRIAAMLTSLSKVAAHNS